MRTILNSFKVLFILILIIGINQNSLQGQMKMKSGDQVIDHRVQPGATVNLEIQTFRGTLQWQISTDGSNWVDWDGHTTNQVEFSADQENYIRVAVISENCSPVYSETVHVILETGPIIITSNVTRVAATEAYSGGKAPDIREDDVLGFGVCWSTAENPTTDDSMVLDNEEYYTFKDFNSCISGLESSTTYFVRAFVMTYDETLYGNQLSFTTEEGSGTFTDERDQKEYKWVYIGGQKWMAENLAWLPDVSPPETYSHTDQHYYVYDYKGSDVSEAKETDNYKLYGVMYNYEASVNSCPSGWHLSTDTEWKVLEKYLGMSFSDVNDIAWRESGSVSGKLKEEGTDHWESPNADADNSTGFTALPGGYHYHEFVDRTGKFGYEGIYTFFGTSTCETDTSAYHRILASGSSFVARWEISKYFGNYVRCIENPSEENTPPEASFFVEPSEGTTDSRFMFYATNCRDAGTNPQDLQVRWDFEGDGIWDTIYNQEKIIYHPFTEPGTYTVILEVLDSMGLTSTTTRQVIVN